MHNRVVACTQHEQCTCMHNTGRRLCQTPNIQKEKSCRLRLPWAGGMQMYFRTKGLLLAVSLSQLDTGLETCFIPK